jgi:hypothetical protein
VSWDKESVATPFSQLVFFAAFQEASGLFDAWVDDCPLIYHSPNAPQKRDVPGTLFLSILAGHRRYAHVTALRSVGVSPNILGMRKIVSEDALRRALGKIPETEGTEWMRKHLLKSVVEACMAPWILDNDTTIKPLFGLDTRKGRKWSTIHFKHRGRSTPRYREAGSAVAADSWPSWHSRGGGL